MRHYAEDSEHPFLGHSMGMSSKKDISEQTASDIDIEVRAILDRNYERTVRVLSENLDILHAMAEALMTYETLEKDQVDDLMARKTPIRAPSWWKA